MAGHEDARVVTGHIGTNTPKFVTPRLGRPPLDPTQTGLCKFGWVWSALIFLHENECYVFFVPPFFLKEFPRFDRLISANLG